MRESTQGTAGPGRENPFSRVAKDVERRVGVEEFTAVPGGGLLLLHREFRRSWWSELGRLLDACERSLGTDLAKIRAVHAAMDPARAWSPPTYQAIAQLRIAIETNDVTGTMDALATIRCLTADTIYDTGRRIESILTEPWERDFVGRMRRYEPLGKNGETTLVLPILGMSLAGFERDIESALDDIRRVDPPLFEEYEQLVSRIKLFQGRVLRGETNTNVYGAVFFRLPPVEYHQPCYWVEHLVHEISHLKLELLRVHDPIVLNDAKCRFQAPFRRDPRPMLGVFHATFVVGRMLRVVTRLAKEPAAAPIYAERIPHLESKFRVGLRVIEENAELTPLGRKIFESLLSISGL
jgi:hypothetical protein